MSKKIIIVDDEPDIRTYLTTLLRDHNYQALGASSSQEGYECIISEHPDLVCIDIMMPGESGISLYKKLQENDMYKDIPVLLISALTRERDFILEEYSQDANLPEPVGYIEKPIDPDKFLEKIKTAIGES